jgi:hypothetical protein
MSKKTPTEKKPTDEAMATLMLDRQERVQRCAKVIEETCKAERVTLIVPGFDIIDGRLVGKIQLVAMD